MNERKMDTMTGYLLSRTGLDYMIYRSPVGDLLVAGDDASLKGIMFLGPGRDAGKIMETLRHRTNESIFRAFKYLDSYFSGGAGEPIYEIRLAFTLEKYRNSGLRKVIDSQERETAGTARNLDLDLSPFTVKELAVYSALVKVSRGVTVSYQELSRMAGIPRGGRFIGNAMAKNYFPILIPCHRVIKSDGSTGNYGGGVDKKIFLLNFEAGKPTPRL